VTNETTETYGPGSRLVEELRLLLDAVADRAGPWLDRVAASSHEEHDELLDREPAGSGGWCPLCAVLALRNGEPSELASRSLERAADLVALLRAVLADRWEPGGPHLPGFRPAPRPARKPGHPEPSPRVQRIPVRRKGQPG
jgi:hypothetical protein